VFAAWNGDGVGRVSTKNTKYKDCSLPSSFLLAAAVTSSISFSSWVKKQVSDAAKSIETMPHLLLVAKS
jgi:hypothetical protein